MLFILIQITLGYIQKRELLCLIYLFYKIVSIFGLAQTVVFFHLQQHFLQSEIF